MSKPKSEARKPSFPERVDGADFERLFEAEREFVAGEDPELKALAISGGGIRSASFGLGIMQALVAGDRLKDFHYLSTVSGGGYLGTSLTWFLKQGLPTPSGSLPAGTSPANFPFGARAPGEKAAAQNAVLSYLRKHSSYLNPTPRLNVVSLAAVVLRTSFVSLFVHFTLLTALMGLFLWLKFFDPIPSGILGGLDRFVPYFPTHCSSPRRSLSCSWPGAASSTPPSCGSAAASTAIRAAPSCRGSSVA